MEYIEAAEAKDMPGLRLALTTGVPGPWGESAKKIFEYKQIAYIPVAQYAGQANEDLVAWTGIRNAPIAVLDNEPGRTNFLDILALAERLKPEPRLIPEDPNDRQLCFGIAADICGEGGWGWKRRILMVGRPRENDSSEIKLPRFDPKYMQLAYSGSQSEAAIASDYLAELLDNFAARLAGQRERGSDYFVGDSLTACDIYWACFSALLEPLPHDVNPMPEWLRLTYGWLGADLEQHRHQILLDHRNLIFERHLGLPLDF